ncbi:hypothetical protein HZZ13_05645 [Bradyrhizobium sp. CNPSo 4010]|uniref:Uncharacterized protein n=1 Tax=Bradyrhizobium agreste TaxID=2751811 RepID=A0ABS0PJ97_9BRAD|nr:hypothetical protein [Bradyrhizobium agreste]MBH5397276.1 hypothetical protein [Bradyrhizobium agreste]
MVFKEIFSMSDLHWVIRSGQATLKPIPGFSDAHPTAYLETARLLRPGVAPRRSVSSMQGRLRVMGSKLEFAAQKRGSDA